MKNFLLKWLGSALSIYITAYLLDAVHVKGFGAALIAAVILGTANMIIKPILVILTLPINIISLGLFLFVVNGVVLKIAAAVVPGFEVYGFFSAIIASIVLSIVHYFIEKLLGIEKE
ncbi:MAG: phage holin family protein [Bacillota bacterium]